MAFFQMNYHSDALMMGVSVNVVLPENVSTMIGMNANAALEFKTLYLLHGLSDDNTIWMRRTSIERYASKYGIAVVMPGVGRSWYTDMANGAKYLTFVGEELPKRCQAFFRGMSTKREDNIVAGLSMGGYGAIKVALTYPERFGLCASLSGALDVSKLDRLGSIEELRGIFGYDLATATELAGTKHDVFALAKQNAIEGMPFPKLYMWCGNDDYLLDNSVRFHELLDELGIEHLYEQSDGCHAWEWWDLHIQASLEYLLNS